MRLSKVETEKIPIETRSYRPIRILERKKIIMLVYNALNPVWRTGFSQIRWKLMALAILSTTFWRKGLSEKLSEKGKERKRKQVLSIQ